MGGDGNGARILGVHVAAGVAYLALVESPERVTFGATDQLALAENTDEWTGLRQFGERVVVEAQRLQVTEVALAGPRMYSRRPTDVARRAAMEVAAGLALCAAAIPIRTVAQRTVAAALGLKLGELDDALRAGSTPLGT